VTGDAAGRVIVWDATAMKEARRVEFGGRVLAVAVSDDGKYTAACVRGKQGAEVYVWETAKPPAANTPIHTQPGEFGGEPFAALTFAPDSKHLAGCAIDKKWLQPPAGTRLNGQVHVWELAAEPKAQPQPKRLVTKPLPKGSSSDVIILNNESLISATGGAIDFRRLRDGEIQFRLGLGKFTIGKMKCSSDRKWLVVEQHPATGKIPAETFDVGVYEAMPLHKATIPSCSQMLDVASGGRVVAVVRDKKVEIWDVATAKLVKTAPFRHTRIDAARFSPDGKLLAVSDRHELVLWPWETDKHERIDLGAPVGALEFSPDGKLLAEGPTPGDAVRVRDVETRKVVQTLANGAKRSMSVPSLAYMQGGRVLVGCDDILLSKDVNGSHRVTLWDTATGAVAHEVALGGGLPLSIDVSPNGRYLAAVVHEGEAGHVLRVWRLDGETPAEPAGPTPPAATRPR